MNNELRPEVHAFATLMEQRLRDKDADKGTSWKEMSIGDLMVKAYAKCHLVGSDHSGRNQHAVDLANHCMMIADVGGALNCVSNQKTNHASGASRLSAGLEGTCKKCGGAMKLGKAIAQTWTGIPDFAGDKHCVTISPGGSGKLIDCLKCEECGWSMTSNAEFSGAAAYSPRPLE